MHILKQNWEVMVMKCLLVADHSEQEMHQKNVYQSGLYYIKTHFIETNQ